MSAVLNSNIDFVLYWVSSNFENYFTNLPKSGVPIIAQVKKKQIEYVLAFYAEKESTTLLEDEIYTEIIHDKYYLKPGFYELYTNNPILYPIIKWTYFC